MPLGLDGCPQLEILQYFLLRSWVVRLTHQGKQNHEASSPQNMLWKCSRSSPYRIRNQKFGLLWKRLNRFQKFRTHHYRFTVTDSQFTGSQPIHFLGDISDIGNHQVTELDPCTKYSNGRRKQRAWHDASDILPLQAEKSKAESLKSFGKENIFLFARELLIIFILCLFIWCLVLGACRTIVFALVRQVLAAPSTSRTNNIRPLQGGYGATGAVRVQSHQHQHQAKMANRTKHQVSVRRIFNPYLHPLRHPLTLP